MSTTYHPYPQLNGLVELDQAGMVLYARFERDDVRRDLSGLNFYSEVAPFSNVEELRQRIDEFTSGRDHANSFNFTCNFDDETVPVRVLVARIREGADSERIRSILVHIRQRNENEHDTRS